MAISAVLIWYLWQKKALFVQPGQDPAPQSQSQSAQTSA
jgi:hypothetical protein